MEYLKKSPRQRRSRNLVNSVLEATGQLLDHSGLSQITVDKISKTTGISVGSLYQYFESKDKVLSGFINYQLNEHHQLYLQKIERLMDSPVDRFVEDFTNFVFEYLNTNQGRLKFVYLYASVFHQHDELMKLREEMIEKLESYLISRKMELNPEVDSKTAATMLVHGTMGLFEKTMSHPDKERLKDAQIQLMKGYLLNKCQS